MSRSSAEEVSTTTGIMRVRSSPLIRRRTSRPSTRGSFKSSRMTLGCSSSGRSAYRPVANTNSRASAPSRTTWTRFPRLCSLKACSVSWTSFGLSSTRSISTARPASLTDVALQREEERRALFGLGLGPDAPAVPVDHSCHDSQPHPGSLVVLRPVHALEHAEQLVGVLHVEPDPIVLHVVDRLAVLVRSTDLDHGGGP